MRQSLWVVLLLAVTGLARAQDPVSVFRKQCMSCHVAPDPQFDVDRAWLTQIKSTA